MIEREYHGKIRRLLYQFLFLLAPFLVLYILSFISCFYGFFDVPTPLILLLQLLPVFLYPSLLHSLSSFLSPFNSFISSYPSLSHSVSTAYSLHFNWLHWRYMREMRMTLVIPLTHIFSEHWKKKKTFSSSLITVSAYVNTCPNVPCHVKCWAILRI